MCLFKKLLKLALISALVIFLILETTAWFMESSSADVLFTDTARIPSNKVGLVLGCSPFLRSGADNLYYKHRMEAAVKLYRSGKVSWLLVSGDNHTKGYDETSAMKQSLISKGIPEERVVCDYAGFSTFDSMLRAQKVFGQKKFTIVTQHDHALRAVYIARSLGLEVVAYPAEDVGAQAGFRTKTREALARVRAVLDLHVFHREPEFLGEPIRIGDGT